MRKTLCFLVVILICSFTYSYSQDSTEIDIGKGWKFRLDYIPFGVVIGAVSTEEPEEAILEAKPFIGSGFSFTFVKNNIWGASVSGLFYTNEKKVYPMLAMGFVLFPGNKVAISLGYDFGKVQDRWEKEKFSNEVKARLKLLVNYNLNILE